MCAHLPYALAPDIWGADVEPAVRACAAVQHPHGKSQVVRSLLLWRKELPSSVGFVITWSWLLSILHSSANVKQSLESLSYMFAIIWLYRDDSPSCFCLDYFLNTTQSMNSFLVFRGPVAVVQCMLLNSSLKENWYSIWYMNAFSNTNRS